VQPQISCTLHSRHGDAPHHRENVGRSAMYSGQIEGSGRLLPSIEDKIVKFPDRRSTVFLEPEGLNTHEVYVNGCHLVPMEVQWEIVRSIPVLTRQRC